jgi:hypothetical protein
MTLTLLQIAQIITGALRLDGSPPRLEGEIDWPQLLYHADGHSLTPLLYTTWREAGQLEQLPPDMRDRMAQAYIDNGRRNENIRRELLDVHQILTTAGVPHLVLKGWPLVEALYADPAERVLYDHDFLVPPDQAQIGHQALQAAGFQPLPGKDEWIEKHLRPLWRNQGYRWDGYLFDPLYPRPVELHVGLWEQNWRGLHVSQLPDVWAQARTTTVAGVPMQLLAPEDMLIHLAMHFAGHLIEREARLNQLLDLARFVRKSSPLDWQRMEAKMTQAGVTRFVYASLFLAHQIFDAPLPPPPVWQYLAAATPPAFRAWLSQHGPADVLTADYRHRHKGQDYRLTFLAAHSLAERLGIIRFAALPPSGQLMSKYNLRHRWLGPLVYPRYIVERVSTYGRGILVKK